MKEFFSELWVQILLGVIVTTTVTFFAFIWKKMKPLLAINKQIIAKIYYDQDNAKRDIMTDIDRSEFFYYFGLRAGFFITADGYFTEVLDHPSKEIKILIASLENPKIADRLNNINVPDKEAYMDFLKGLHLTLKTRVNGRRNISYRTHLEPIVFRLFITDKFLYFSYYEKGKTSEKSTIYKVKSDTDLYRGFLLYFNEVWGD